MYITWKVLQSTVHVLSFLAVSKLYFKMAEKGFLEDRHESNTLQKRYMLTNAIANMTYSN